MSGEFFQAIRQGDLEEVKRLLASAPSLIHEKENGLSPVLVAAYHKKAEVADFLVEKSGNLNIFEAAAVGKTHRIMRLLARDPLLVNAYAEDGYQPLGIACFCGQVEAARTLVKAGAAINSPSRNDPQVTPLQSAVSIEHVKIVNLLLSHDANPNVRERNGRTPLHTAAQNGNLDIIRALLFNGAVLTARDLDGKFPLALAIESGHTKAEKLLKEGITRRFRENRIQK